MRRLRWRLPRLVVLVVGFLLVNGIASLNDSDLLGYDAGAAAALDGLSMLVLGLVIVNARRAARSVELLVDEARYRAEEYERARADYATLVRHRMFNPLTVIRGGAATLRAGQGDEASRARILDGIAEATRELERMTLEAERAPEERDLRPRPEPRRSERGDG